jgi:hypothetical protein
MFLHFFQEFLAKYQFLLQDADLMHCAEMRGASLQDVDYKLECAQEQEGDFMVSCAELRLFPLHMSYNIESLQELGETFMLMPT